MSLHDMYFSSKNKNHIFNIIKDLVLKETSEDISKNSEYIDLYRFKYSLIFDRTDCDNIIDLNKSLIDEIAPIFINDINSKYSIKKESKSEMKQEIKINEWREYYINSSDRIKNSLNNYNYTVKLPKNIDYFNLKEISIPLENNILFKNPIICININDNKIYCQFINKIEFNNKKFNIYRPGSITNIKNEKDINIKILTNNLSVIKDKNDTIKIDKLKNIIIKDINYLCLKIKENHNITKKDTILLYENNIIKKKIIVDLKVENNLLIKNEEIDFDNSKDYLIINSDLENNIILNVN